MAGIPKGFGLKFDPSKVGPSTVSARPSSKRDRTKPPAEDKAPKKRDASKAAVDGKGAPDKRTKTASTSSSMMITELSSPAASFIKDEDVKKWKTLSPEKENQALIHASAQLLIASLGRAQRLEEEGARRKKAEAEVYKLSQQMKDMEQNHARIFSQQEDRINIFKKDVDNYVEISQHLSSTIDKQNLELSDLKARHAELIEEQKHGWQAEKTKIQEESYAQGFRHYATGFLANDPDYDFTKFGEETVQWIAQFKIDEAAAIKAQRVQLGLEENETVEEGAPGDHAEEEETASYLQTPLDNPLNVTPLQVIRGDAGSSANPPVQGQGAPGNVTSPKN